MNGVVPYWITLIFRPEVHVSFTVKVPLELIIDQRENECISTSVPHARVQFPAMAEYFKGLLFG